MKAHRVLVITGPTGTGKSDFGIKCAERIGGEVINADAGQLYAPLAIGTAMPKLEDVSIPHHLFGYITTPSESTAFDWFERARLQMYDCFARGKVPIVVGGSGFYLSSLFYPVTSETRKDVLLEAEAAEAPIEELLEKLGAIDPQRAREIHPNDRYRITRALEIAATGVMPSSLKPKYAPVVSDIGIFAVDRKDEDLQDRIKKRIAVMIESGWQAEVEGLNEEWMTFALRRGFIGYRQMIAISRGLQSETCPEPEIAKETWLYVKKQRKYLRSLRKKLSQNADVGVFWRECCLTSENSEVYLDQIQSLYTS